MAENSFLSEGVRPGSTHMGDVVTLRLAVIGAGVMGANHIRVGKSLPMIDLVAVVDGDLERAEAARGDDDTIRCLPDLAALLDSMEVDAVIVAVPTAIHHEVAVRTVEAGLHTFVEKPFTTTLNQADDLIARAKMSDVQLMVGHVERFNPVVTELVDHVDAPVHIETERVGPFTSRIKDSVVLDLMIHDLDIVTMLAGSEVTDISGVARSVRSDGLDLASVHLAFANGVTARLTASRLGQQKIRQIRVTNEESYVTADLLRQDISVSRVAHVEYVSDRGTSYRQSGMVEVPFIENRGEPLALEQREFIASITEGRSPLVDGRAGRRVLELVERVHQAVIVT